MHTELWHPARGATGPGAVLSPEAISFATPSMPPLSKTLAPLLKSLVPPQRKRSRRIPPRRRPTTVNNPAWGRSMPAAYASHVRPRFNVTSRTATSARVAGCDLVYRIPSEVAGNITEELFCVIPANPAYWVGTRIAQFAPAYTTYRPLRLTFSYIPQVAVTQDGTVAMGTLWNTAVGSEDIQQSLFTSNGGCLTQCYVPCDTTIQLGSNLQQNLFQLKGALSEKTNPFLFAATMAGASVVPGYFYVTYEYEFKNPIGESWTYNTDSGLAASLLATTPPLPNVSFVLLSQDGRYGPGTVFDVEGTQVFYAGTPVTLSGSSYVRRFMNGQTQGSTALVRALSYDISEASSDRVRINRVVTGNGSSYELPGPSVYTMNNQGAFTVGGAIGQRHGYYFYVEPTATHKGLLGCFSASRNATVVLNIPSSLWSSFDGATVRAQSIANGSAGGNGVWYSGTSPLFTTEYADYTDGGDDVNVIILENTFTFA